MKATELRIGNYYDHCGEIKKVTVAVIENVYDSERIWCKPVELTKEILLDCGFRQLSKYTYVYKGFFVKKDVLRFKVFCGKLQIEIKYLHQLQNIYFALKGKEIVLKLDNLKK